ncbi:SusD/RagB family nutrient-binding outer membrane lipoprotein [Chitinophaga sp. sic0106]|uniref:SusD/RagB family nutrient-binding outer membrane lipoprotein n=1 Tax=Chitinophaga sp. sic0106 TaxID=2854785 RepID=UPI001C455DA0|nr:SusD/RagB family nutrient-binding outer membrane lipoprotein [Chitinophaga sp. sic0106]MBV7532917.1 SusD/RagB family nutrient-binding outer membrane lipoprotein [Chitinophaga sp. sic0106]
MKRKYLVYIGASLSLLAASCTKDLEDLNKNPNNPTSVPPLTMFSNAEVATATLGRGTIRRTNLAFDMMAMQQLASTETLDGGEGDKYLKNDNAGNLFEDSYGLIINNVVQLMEFVKNDPAQVNLLSATRIWKVLVFQRLTDAYGDVPYFDAGKGFISGNFAPDYNKQSEIYADMLKELSEAVAAFDAAKNPLGTADVVYNGDLTKWKKLAYSLMLKLALRMEKQDAAKAKEWAGKALAGGVMSLPEDVCAIKHSAERNAVANPITYTFNSYDLANEKIKISKYFLDYLTNTGDPRRRVFVSTVSGDTTLASQKGLPNGLDANSFKTAYPTVALKDFSTLNTKTILQLTAPTFLLTPAEVQLMQAELIVKGWTTGDAAAMYAAAVTNSMKQQAMYGDNGVISATQIQDYLAANPFPGTAAEQLKALGSQYWVATFLNGWESHANWRRTGYPAITPVNYPGNITNGQIPRRLTYMLSEQVNNPKGLQSSITNQGKDEYMTRVWWDKQ